MESFELKDFEIGDKLTSSKFREKLNKLVASVRSCYVQPGVGYLINRGKDGTTLNIKPGKGGSSAASDHPFKVTVREKEGESGVYEAIVGTGNLMKSLKPNDTQTITGLDAYFDLIATDAIWLEVGFTDNAVSSAQINSWGEGDSFDVTAQAWTTDSFVEDDSATAAPGEIEMVVARILIAHIETPDDVPELTQVVNTDLVMTSCAIYNRGAIYPFATYGTYVL